MKNYHIPCFPSTCAMKNMLLCLLTLLTCSHVQAQSIINYGPDGEKTKKLSEYVELSLEPTSTAESLGSPIALVGIALGPVFNIVSSTIKKSLEKRQKQFVASYSNSAEFSEEDLKRSGRKGSVLHQNLVITRYAIDALNQLDQNHLMATYCLRMIPSDSPDKLQLELQSITLNQSKAKYKKGEHLSIALTIKATAQHTTEATAPETTEVPAQPRAKATGLHTFKTVMQPPATAKAKPDAKTETTTKEAEGTITVPLVKVSKDMQDFTPFRNVVNPIILHGIDLSTATSLKLAVSITETNVNHLTSSEITTLVMDNTGDIQTILKSLFGVQNE